MYSVCVKMQESCQRFMKMLHKEFQDEVLSNFSLVSRPSPASFLQGSLKARMKLYSPKGKIKPNDLDLWYLVPSQSQP